MKIVEVNHERSLAVLKLGSVVHVISIILFFVAAFLFLWALLESESILAYIAGGCLLSGISGIIFSIFTKGFSVIVELSETKQALVNIKYVEFNGKIREKVEGVKEHKLDLEDWAKNVIEKDTIEVPNWVLPEEIHDYIILNYGDIIKDSEKCEECKEETE